MRRVISPSTNHRIFLIANQRLRGEIIGQDMPPSIHVNTLTISRQSMAAGPIAVFG